MKKFTLKNFLLKMQDPKQRKYFYAIFGSKLLGLAACFAIIFAVSAFLGSSGSKAHAQDATTNAMAGTNAAPAMTGTNTPAAATPAPAPPDPPYCSPINTMWVLVTAFLVFFMQAGFMFLEAGFARERETINVLLEGIVDTCLCGILFYLWGFAWMFGHGSGIIGWGDGAGHSWYCLQNLPDTYESTGVATLAFFLFQFAFADTCST
ncbi:MAG TPA: ammonium transporter, partial [Verrucomicrobiae bacterium]|nr:ammonium transporter [Verrucomicrobiae bacterium]